MGTERSAESAERNRPRVLRGGSWDFAARLCRAAFRNGCEPGFRDWFFGFRVCLVPGPPASQDQTSGADDRSRSEGREEEEGVGGARGDPKPTPRRK